MNLKGIPAQPQDVRCETLFLQMNAQQALRALSETFPKGSNDRCFIQEVALLLHPESEITEGQLNALKTTFTRGATEEEPAFKTMIRLNIATYINSSSPHRN